VIIQSNLNNKNTQIQLLTVIVKLQFSETRCTPISNMLSI